MPCPTSDEVFNTRTCM